MSTIASGAERGPPRIVLDTNVCLDLFVFADPRVAPLRDALRSGALSGVTDEACRDEWQRVLAYPVLKLDDATRATCLSDYDAVMRVGTFPRTESNPLPRCADPDDQKFLELAAGCEARWLLSRDDALLKLARRMQRECSLDILTPAQWVEAWSSPR
ncbi:PIN domain-containing protein [Lysobacter panacisoli]|uniref:Toxin-antitoxin system toxin component, PIN family n=1 Tax=Lysobacter panacisoli TaxID=1255263 RepID=A0ABP9LIJ3_9GAMM|nr:PIN domain-containing protein [Lysobacter panacisoli]